MRFPLMRLLFPAVCGVCGRELVDGERVMCLHCNMGMPRTYFHLNQFNSVHQRLAPMNVERAASWFFYQRQSRYAALIHEAKYRGMYSIVKSLAEAYAQELAGAGFFDGIDIIEPVPMHWLKRAMRGYNQSEEIARGLERVTGIVTGDHLKMARWHATQTRRGAYARYQSTRRLFEVVRGEELDGLHVLLVDDVVTSGATLLACCEELRAIVPTVRISVLTLAATRMV